MFDAKSNLFIYNCLKEKSGLLFMDFYKKRIRNFVFQKKVLYFCNVFTGCSAVRLAHLLWEQGVVGSNPATPTNKKHLLCKCFNGGRSSVG